MIKRLSTDGFFSKPGDIGNKAKRETLAERVTYFAAQLINVICGWFRFHDFTAEKFAPHFPTLSSSLAKRCTLQLKSDNLEI